MVEDGATTMSWREVCARRLSRHWLAAPADAAPATEATPAGVVAAMCGAHSQIPTAAELSVALRLAGATRADVQDALWTDHSLIRTYGPRGTLHLLPAADLDRWLGALQAATPDPDLPEEAELTPDQVDAVVEAIGAALTEADLTMDELHDEVVGRTGPWAGELVVPYFRDVVARWRPVVWEAARRGVLCFVAPRGRRITYASPHRWLPDLRPADPDAAVGWLIRRYLHAYGPATSQQFAQWLAVGRTWAAERFAALGHELEPVDVEGARTWQVAGDDAAAGDAAGAVRLLPYFDAYAVGCHPRERVFPGEASDRALSGGQAGALPVLLVDGVVAGVWHHRRKGKRLEVTVEPFDTLTKRQRRELDDRIDRVGQILDGRPEVTFGPIPVGPHA